MQTEIQKRFEDAASYDTMMAGVFPGYAQLPNMVLSYLRTCINQSAHLLDVGCGTGAILEACAAHQPEWSFTGVDPAGPMLEIARNRMNMIGAEHRVSLLKGTVDQLPDQPQFDAATCILVEHLLPDDGTKLRLFTDIWRRLKPGGWFILFGLNGNLQTDDARQTLSAWLEFITLQGLPQAARENVRHRATVEDSLIPEARIRELLRDAGFMQIKKIHQVHLLGGWLAQR